MSTAPEIMTGVRCDHCLLAFRERDAVRETVDGKEKVFCCSGCRGVYRLIHDEGLEDFYGKRTGWRPGPPEDGEVRTESFSDSVQARGDEREVSIHLSGIRCASCIWLIEHYLRKFPGILDVTVNYATHRARIVWTDTEIALGTILNRIRSLGYLPRPYSASVIEEELSREKKDLLIRFGTAAFFSMQLMLYTAALYAGYFQGIEPLYRKVFEFVAWALATPVMFYCGYPFLKNALQGIKNRRATMDTLIFIGSFSAYAYSVIAIVTGGEVYFDTSAMIITLILLGRFIESGARSKATGVITSLLAFQPKEARLIGDGGSDILAPVSSLRAGDRIRVIPGERVPADCVVLEGSSEVNESMLTGESMPVSKAPGAEVFGGTMNLNGSLVLEVKKTGSDSLISRIVRAVEDSQARKAPVQKIADRVVGWFVPLIILIASATLLFWTVRGYDATVSLMNAISVLVIACPCALGLATPLAVLAGSGILSSEGIFIKGGDVVETLARADHVCFDKTGTLTTGMPSLIDRVTYGGDGEHLLRIAASLEKDSEHAIAKALRAEVEDQDLLPVEAFRAHPGRGVEGLIQGEHYAAGNIAFLESLQVAITTEQRRDFLAFAAKGRTVIGLAARELKGWFVIADDLRPEAPEVVQKLNGLGYGVSLLTGDHTVVAEDIGKRTGIAEIHAEILPVGKADEIRKMKTSGRRIVMIGDGINDAPALAEADAGVAMGSATDIAIESAGAVLMRNDLRLIPRLLGMSRKILTVIRENLFWAFSYNLIAIPLAVAGLIHPIISAAFMALSSLLVVGNSLRLHRMK
jgi:Cu2+-exporting ATPase